jgi:two-component system response regulator
MEAVVVEDDPNDTELIVRVLREHDLADKIVLLKDGAEALDFLFAPGGDVTHGDGSSLRVVFLDLKLPKVDGMEVLRRMKADARIRTIPVVILTSSTEPRDLKEAYELGANSFVAKPIQFEEFSRAVAQLAEYWLVLNKPPVRRA